MMTRTIFLSLLFVLLLFTDCSRGKREQNQNSNSSRRERTVDNSKKGKSIVKMRAEGGVYMVPCEINGSRMEFIFDTGASDITISLTEALFLYKQGTLTDDDFIGVQNYQIADGSIHEGAVVKLKSVKIGDRVLYNIKASIVDNMNAPLLLGQSALAEFGKISIDYQKKEIIFE
jgi:aspartyl protease family protein